MSGELMRKALHTCEMPPLKYVTASQARPIVSQMPVVLARRGKVVLPNPRNAPDWTKIIAQNGWAKATARIAATPSRTTSASWLNRRIIGVANTKEIAPIIAIHSTAHQLAIEG